MKKAAGIALEASMLRMVYRVRGTLATKEISWDPANPEIAIEQLRAEVGRPRVLALSIGLGFLEVARPDLPPLSDIDRHRLLQRDADRYFPLEGTAAVAEGRAGGVAFALGSEQLQRWIAAFEKLAPVRAVVAAPNSIADALTTRGVELHSLVIDAGFDEGGVMSYRNGTVTVVRRVPLSLAPGVINGTRSVDEQVVDGAPGRFAAAIGALDSLQAPLETMLLDATLDRSLRAVRRQRTWISYAMFAAMIVLLVISTNLSRERKLLTIQHGVDSLTVAAAPALAAATRLSSLDNEARALRARSSSRNGAFEVFAALSKALPSDVFVQRLERNGAAWRLDGSASQAASIVPQLDAAGMFRNVRILSASTRFRDGNRMRESFSIGFETSGGISGKR